MDPTKNKVNKIPFKIIKKGSRFSQVSSFSQKKKPRIKKSSSFINKSKYGSKSKTNQELTEKNKLDTRKKKFQQRSMLNLRNSQKELSKAPSLKFLSNLTPNKSNMTYRKYWFPTSESHYPSDSKVCPLIAENFKGIELFRSLRKHNESHLQSVKKKFIDSFNKEIAKRRITLDQMEKNHPLFQFDNLETQPSPTSRGFVGSPRSDPYSKTSRMNTCPDEVFQKKIPEIDFNEYFKMTSSMKRFRPRAKNKIKIDCEKLRKFISAAKTPKQQEERKRKKSSFQVDLRYLVGGLSNGKTSRSRFYSSSRKSGSTEKLQRKKSNLRLNLNKDLKINSSRQITKNYLLPNILASTPRGSTKTMRKHSSASRRRRRRKESLSRVDFLLRTSLFWRKVGNKNNTKFIYENFGPGKGIKTAKIQLKTPGEDMETLLKKNVPKTKEEKEMEYLKQLSTFDLVPGAISSKHTRDNVMKICLNMSKTLTHLYLFLGSNYIKLSNYIETTVVEICENSDLMLEIMLGKPISPLFKVR